jgi:hypothetical protein
MDQSPQTHHVKIFDIITSRRMAWVALAAAIGYAIAGFAVGGEGMWLVILGVPPLLLLSGVLWLPWLAAAWAGAVLGVVIALFGFSIGPLAGGILALIGLAAFVSELPHLRHPQHAGTAH